jgi:hypothetical protein
MTVSSTAEDMTMNWIPASRRISARREDADARMSFVGGKIG